MYLYILPLDHKGSHFSIAPLLLARHHILAQAHICVDLTSVKPAWARAVDQQFTESWEQTPGCIQFPENADSFELPQLRNPT